MHPAAPGNTIEILHEIDGMVYQFASQSDVDLWALTAQDTWHSVRPATRSDRDAFTLTAALTG